MRVVAALLIAANAAALVTALNADAAQPNAFSTSHALSAAAVDKAFGEFRARYKKTYASPAEETYRKAVLADNLAAAAARNAAQPPCEGSHCPRFGLTKFSDLTKEEFRKRHLAPSEAALQRAMGVLEANASHYDAASGLSADSLKPANVGYRFSSNANTNNGTVVDWRAEGVVHPIRFQGDCGSCWAFAATANIESQWAIKYKGDKAQFRELSVQELVSCDTLDMACYGGITLDAFKWIMDKRSGWIASEASFPYAQTTETNNIVPCPGFTLIYAAKITSYKLLPRDNETELARWVREHGPIALAVDATSFNDYYSGIMSDCISKRVNHAVVVVGYDTTFNPPYWIIRNSWDSDWGEEGYMRLAMGSNQCNVTRMPTTSFV